MRRSITDSTQHLGCQRRLRGRGLRTTMRTFLALFLPLFNPLQGLVNANGQVLDHRILHTQAAFEFLHRSCFCCELQQNVEAFPVLFNPVGQTPLAPLIDFVNRTTSFGDMP